MHGQFHTPEGLELAEDALEPLRCLAKKYGASCAQIALAWAIGHDRVVAVAGAMTVLETKENAGASEISLVPEDVARLDAASDAIAESSRRLRENRPS
jgi:aryl-alcohol dehydrogenase-like predicted oxidoreductase